MQYRYLTERKPYIFLAKWKHIRFSSYNLPVVTWSKMANKQSIGRTRLLPELCQYAGAILCPERTNIIIYLKSSIVNCWNCSKFVRNFQKATGFSFSVNTGAFQPISTYLLSQAWVIHKLSDKMHAVTIIWHGRSRRKIQDKISFLKSVSLWGCNIKVQTFLELS